MDGLEKVYYIVLVYVDIVFRRHTVSKIRKVHGPYVSIATTSDTSLAFQAAPSS